jgi:hypothetical protein
VASAVGIISGIVGSKATQAPLKVALQQIELIQSGKSQEAYELFTDITKSQLAFTAFSDMKYTKLLENGEATVTFSDRNVTGLTAEISGNVAYGAKIVPITYSMEQHEKVWQIRNIIFR